MEFVLPALLSGAASALVGGLFNKKPDDIPMPTVEKPTAMPDPMAQKSKARRKAALFAGQQLSAANTVLSGGNDTLGA